VHHTDDARPPSAAGYTLVAAILLTFWTAIAVCVGAVVVISAWDHRDRGEAVAVEPTASPTIEPTATATPPVRPVGVPLSARPVEGAFDTGEPQQHLFFHIGCEQGVLSVVTTDERVYAQTFCPPPVPRELRERFLGKPVRITIADRRIEISSPAVAERLQFPIDRAWVEVP
jgi:hypothetical protein